MSGSDVELRNVWKVCFVSDGKGSKNTSSSVRVSARIYRPRSAQHQVGKLEEGGTATPLSLMQAREGGKMPAHHLWLSLLKV